MQICCAISSSLTTSWLAYIFIYCFGFITTSLQEPKTSSSPLHLKISQMHLTRSNKSLLEKFYENALWHPKKNWYVWSMPQLTVDTLLIWLIHIDSLSLVFCFLLWLWEVSNVLFCVWKREMGIGSLAMVIWDCMPDWECTWHHKI